MMKARLFRSVSRYVLHPWFRLTRGATLGVRVVVIDAEGRFLLVRHTYAPGWLFPGGGVERGETVYDAVRRETLEESGVIVDGVPQLHGVFANHQQFYGDHVACFVVRTFRREPFSGTREIVEARFYAPDDLPADATGGTRRRVAEILGERDISPDW
jgi:8-oxo-dGTP pyrophosphatase MutT (NUDIX family)